jgi:N-acetylglutamate synthase-like GNAT family acetyltransferase
MMHFQNYQGHRADLLPFFRMADESESEILSYYELGEAIVAVDDGRIVGMAHVEQIKGTVQIRSLAVLPERRREGIGCGLIEASAQYCRHKGGNRLIVCTAAWEVETIAFYIRRGFRLFHVERMFFTAEQGYAEAGDQVQFEMYV